MRLNRAIKAAGMLGAMHLMGEYRKNAADLIRIQTAKIYLKSVEFLRDLVVYQIGILICTAFLALGMVMMQAAALFYFPLDLHTRAGWALALGAVDFFSALAFICYFCSPRSWLKFAAKHNECLEEFLEETAGTNGRGCRHTKYAHSNRS